MYSGKLTQLQNFPLSGDSQELRSYFHVYNLLGDPSLEMWTGVPRSVSVAYPATFPVGSSSFEVRVRDLSGRPVREALVCLLKAGELHVRALTDSSGMARFAIAVSTPGSMLVTVTASAGSALAGTALAGSGANLAPYLGSSTCVSAGVFVGHLSHDPQSAGPGRTVSLSVVLKNFGTSQTAPGVSATLRPLDGSATVTDSVRNYGDIGPGGTKSAPAFAVATAPACTSAQRIPFLVVVKSGDSTWQSGLEIPVAGPTLSSIGYTVHDGNGVLDPGETAELSVAVRNTGSGTAPGLTGVLRSVNPAAIQVLDSAGWFGDVQPGDSASCALDRFQVHASSGIGAGRRFSLRLVLRTSDGAEQLWDFPMTVGLATGSSPLGPDRHGYYAYDDTDAGYPERPVFDWVEIDPSQGGAGTHAALANDTAVPVSLPFAFRFYGREYDAVSVCDNGYLAMGSQWLGDVYNWHIPSPAGPDGLVAAFWDDFRTDTLGAPGVFTWYDAGNHRFIVEWSRCIHAHGFKPPVMADTQSFEVLLYDPQYHLTATGDGPIVVQYLAVRNDDTLFENNHNFATVGIQSPDHGDGLEYTFAGAYPVTAAEVVPGRAIRFTTNPPDTFTLIREGARSRGPASGFSIRPNPARRRVAIVPPRSGERLMLRVFDAAGRLVRRWPAGQAEWDLRDNEGVRVAAGVYQLLLADRSGSPRWRGRVLVLDE
jgi:hypothetical protein